MIVGGYTFLGSPTFFLNENGKNIQFISQITFDSESALINLILIKQGSKYNHIYNIETTL